MVLSGHLATITNTVGHHCDGSTFQVFDVVNAICNSEKPNFQF
jgi:hypothetical protein